MDKVDVYCTNEILTALIFKKNVYYLRVLRVNELKMRFLRQFLVYVVLVIIGVAIGITVGVLAGFIATIPLILFLDSWVAFARIIGGFGGGIALVFIVYRIYLDYRGANISLIIDEERLGQRELILKKNEKEFVVEIPLFFTNNGSKSGVLAEVWVDGSLDSYGNMFNESLYKQRIGYLESKGIAREMFSFITKKRYFSKFEYDTLAEPRLFPRETSEMISFPFTINEKASMGFSLRLEYYFPIGKNFIGKMMLKENERLSLEIPLKFKTIRKGKIETKEGRFEVIRIIKYA